MAFKSMLTIPCVPLLPCLLSAASTASFVVFRSFRGFLRGFPQLPWLPSLFSVTSAIAFLVFRSFRVCFPQLPRLPSLFLYSVSNNVVFRSFRIFLCCFPQFPVVSATSVLFCCLLLFVRGVCAQYEVRIANADVVAGPLSMQMHRNEVFAKPLFIPPFLTVLDSMAFVATSKGAVSQLQEAFKRHFALERSARRLVVRLRGRLTMPSCLTLWGGALQILRSTQWHRLTARCNQDLLARAAVTCAASCTTLSGEEDAVVKQELLGVLRTAPRVECCRMQALLLNDMARIL